MATDSQIAANRENALSSTGPRTEVGKQASARNALTHGLFTEGDFVRSGEEADYQALCEAFMADLQPDGPLELTHVATIIGSSWRLRRCNKAEADLVEYLDYDPMEDARAERVHRSVERCRSQAFRLLRTATAELRRLQTERAIRKELDSPHTNLAGTREIQFAQRAAKLSQQSGSPKSGSNCKPPARAEMEASCPHGSRKSVGSGSEQDTERGQKTAGPDSTEWDQAA